MPTKVIYYQGTTETFLPPAVPRGALETADAPRTKRKRPIRSDDPDVLPPISAPAVTAAPNGWDTLDSPIAKRKRPRAEEAQLVISLAAAPTAWDMADPLPRRRKPQRAEDTGLTFQAFIVPAGWDISDPRPFKRPAKQRDEAQSIVPPFAIPAGWEVEQRQRPIKRRGMQADDTLPLAPVIVDAFGWQQDSLQRSIRLRIRRSDADILFPVPLPVVIDVPAELFIAVGLERGHVFSGLANGHTECADNRSHVDAGIQRCLSASIVSRGHCESLNLTAIAIGGTETVGTQAIDALSLIACGIEHAHAFVPQQAHVAAGTERAHAYTRNE